jgi:hypothetical protein
VNYKEVKSLACVFKSSVVSEWKAESSVTYKGVRQGKRHEDKGTIPWLAPENYNTVGQNNIQTEESADHSKQNRLLALETMKRRSLKSFLRTRGGAYPDVPPI